MIETRFKGVAEALREDKTSIFSRLTDAVRTDGAKIVVVGAGGVGKTETINRVLKEGSKVPATFELRAWYIKEAGIGKKEYTAGSSEQFEARMKDQLSRLDAKKIKEILAGKEGNVLFFDEVDLGVNGGILNQFQLDALQLLLTWGDEAAAKRSKVVVLHPPVSPAVIELVGKLGYPQPGNPQWIDFGNAYSSAVEAEIARALVADCTGDDTVAKGRAATSIAQYIQGHPTAYLPFLIDKKGVLSGLKGKTPTETVEAVKKVAVERVGGNLIGINIGLLLGLEAKKIIKTMLTAPNGFVPPSGTELDHAVGSTGVMVRNGSYYIPPVEHDALRNYCADGDDKAQQKIEPICDSFQPGSGTATKTTIRSRSYHLVPGLGLLASAILALQLPERL